MEGLSDFSPLFNSVQFGSIKPDLETMLDALVNLRLFWMVPCLYIVFREMSGNVNLMLCRGNNGQSYKRWRL